MIKTLKEEREKRINLEINEREEMFTQKYKEQESPLVPNNKDQYEKEFISSPRE